MDGEAKRYIPESIKREIRQRCGFGCVICGNPIYEFEHMKEWAKVKEHVAEDMTLLCYDHHGQRTKGLLPIDLVKKYNKNPFNKRKGKSKSNQLYFYGNFCSFLIGGNTFKMDGHNVFPTFLVPILINETPLLSFNMYKNQLLLNANVFDQNGHLILKIVNNHLEYSIGVWDITFIQNTLTIHQAKRDILLKIKFETPNKVVIDRAKFFYNHEKVIVHKDNIIIGKKENTQMKGITMSNFPIGVSIGENEFKNVSIGIKIVN